MNDFFLPPDALPFIGAATIVAQEPIMPLSDIRFSSH
jgi:hypothetical protein